MIGLHGGSIDGFFTHGEYGFGSLGSWLFSREWEWNSMAKLCYMTSEE